jgi:ribulose kinase
VNRGDGGGGSMIYVIAYDFGTTGVKTCLFEIGDKVKLLVGCYASYGLYILENGGAEQDADEWWDAMCRTTKEVFHEDGYPAGADMPAFPSARRCRGWCWSTGTGKRCAAR